VRPVLAPAARRLWRGSGTLQLCTSPQRGVLVEGLDPQARRVLPLLDGVRTREQIITDARAAGCADPEPLLQVLADTGLLVDGDALQVPSPDREERHRLGPDLAALALHRGSGAADALRARREARVVVHGAGRVGGPLAALLAEAGVGTVDLRDQGEARWEDTAVGGLRAHDVGRPRAQALAPRLRSVGSSAAPALVVLTEDVGEQLARVLVRDGVPHLVARADALVGTVGPLVLPHRSPCLRCLALVREAIDPDWRHLLAAEEAAPRAAEASHGVLAAAVAAQAALQALELLEGDEPASVGGTLELAVPGWRWRRRTWPSHPGCDCEAATPPFEASA
jgi:bacteriocin biosynthesis cyclodehydratase domain-containing protein